MNETLKLADDAAMNNFLNELMLMCAHKNNIPDDTKKLFLEIACSPEEKLCSLAILFSDNKNVLELIARLLGFRLLQKTSLPKLDIEIHAIDTSLFSTDSQTLQ